MNRAICLVNDKQYDEALLQTDSIAKRWPKIATTYSLKAEIYLNKKDTLKAEQWLDKSIELDAFDASSWLTKTIYRYPEGSGKMPIKPFLSRYISSLRMLHCMSIEPLHASTSTIFVVQWTIMIKQLSCNPITSWRITTEDCFACS